MEENTWAYNALHKAKTKFYTYQQADNKTLADYMHNFNNLCTNIEYHGGDIFFDKDMVKREMRADICKDKTITVDRDEYRE